MKIVIPGGSGQVGTILARAFHRGGHDVVVLSRQPQRSLWRVVAWDGATLGKWQREVDGCDVVINLAGRSVNCRYTAANRDQIMQSRVLSTRVVGQAIAAATCKATRVAAGEYRHGLFAPVRQSERRVLRHSRWP
jgi:NAD dependent epimerase/dehydratase family enzyme